MADSKKMGRPVTKIDWDEVKKMMSYQCTQEEVADFFATTTDTLDARCRDEFGITFSEFWRQKKAFGRVKIRKVTMQLAEQGSTGAAIWLSKQYLNQTDKPVDAVLLEAAQKAGLSRDEAVEAIMNASKLHLTKDNKSFQEFCRASGYPAPYPKQIEMMEFGMHETVPRLLLGARGYGKSDYAVILGTAYDLYLNPNLSTNLIITKSKERNAAMLREIEQACIANGMVFEQSNSVSLRVAGLRGKDHSVSAVTIKTVTLRGRHPKRVMMDDPVTEDDVSEATRKHVNRVYNEVNKLCQNVLIIGQPAHKHDLYAKLRPLLKIMEVPHGTIPELDADLEAMALAGVDANSIAMSYHLKIPDEGTTPFDKINYVDRFPAGDSIAFIDPSHEGEDFTALTILRAWMDGVAVVGFTYKRAWNHCLDDMVKHMNAFGVKKLAFETNALGDQPIIMLRQIFGGGVIGRKTTTNKHSRIMAAGSYAHLIHLSRESDKTYTDQVVQYEYKAKNDDAPDSLASCLEWLGLIRGKR